MKKEGEMRCKRGKKEGKKKVIGKKRALPDFEPMPGLKVKEVGRGGK